ncbi:unnamed protein product [Phytomonas sp. Hart1]|nr:unnamed protein product [Phytomonas sp. Hart1]|eukprot:CCW71175.1 unnamed protein product [Phytomonas sp. isolate Hart1]
MSDLMMKTRPGYKCLLNKKILDRVIFLSRILNLTQLERRFVHLSSPDGAWRCPLEGHSSEIDLAPFIDHTQLQLSADRAAFEKLCGEPQRFNFKVVCVNGSRVALCRALLTRNTANTVKVGGVCGFPLGQTTTAIKAAEAMVKASGGVRDRQTALQYIETGVHRIGTSSGIAIISKNEPLETFKGGSY